MIRMENTVDSEALQAAMRGFDLELYKAIVAQEKFCLSQRRIRGQQLQGEIVPELFTLFQNFPPGLSPSMTTKEKKR